MSNELEARTVNTTLQDPYLEETIDNMVEERTTETIPEEPPTSGTVENRKPSLSMSVEAQETIIKLYSKRGSMLPRLMMMMSSFVPNTDPDLKLLHLR